MAAMDLHGDWSGTESIWFCGRHTDEVCDTIRKMNVHERTEAERPLMADIVINEMTRGYVQVYTGDGKGKTTAAIGLAVRAVGAGLKVYIGQFIKEMEYGEIRMIRERVPEITAELFGTEAGCIIDRAPDEKDRQAAREGLAHARESIRSGDYQVVILDELTIAIDLGLISPEEAIGLIEEKPDHVELIITGRNAPEEILARADLISEVREERHYYRQGVLSRRGIEC